MKRSITVLVADDHVGLAAALTQSLGRRFLTEGSVNTPQQLRGAMREWRAREGWRAGPLVVLLDIHFGEQAESGLELLADLVVTCPEARYVMHSLYGSRVFVHQALALGAIGFVDKCCGLTEMEKAIEAAAASRVAVYTKEDVGGGRGQAARRPSRPLPPVLRRVLALLQAGRKRAEIAEILGVTLSAVESDITRLRRAFGVQGGGAIDWRECSPNS